MAKSLVHICINESNFSTNYYDLLIMCIIYFKVQCYFVKFNQYNKQYDQNSYQNDK